MSFEGPVSKGVLKQKFHDVLITSLAVIGFAVILLFNLTRSDSISNSSLILEKAFILSMELCLFMLLFAFSYQINKRQSMCRFLALLKDFDEKVRIETRP